MVAVRSATLCRVLKWEAGDTLTAEERGVLQAHDTQAPDSFGWIACLAYCQQVHVIGDAPVWYAVHALRSSASQQKCCKEGI